MTPSTRWLTLWAVIMLLSLGVGALYVRANLPPLPGHVWVVSYPSSKTPADLQREAESNPAYLRALSEAGAARRGFIMQALALWLAAGATLYVAGSSVQQSRRGERHS